MTSDEFAHLLTALSVDWTEGNYEQVAARFRENVFYSDAHNYAFNDRSSLLSFFRDDEGQPQYCRFHNFVFDEVRQIGAAEYTYQGTFRYHGTAWIEMRDDKIAGWREYQYKSAENWRDLWKFDGRDRS